MNILKAVLAGLSVLALLGLVAWGAVSGFGYVREVLAPIDAFTMALVVAAWVGLLGGGALIALGVRSAAVVYERTSRRQRKADAYAWLLGVLGSMEHHETGRGRSSREVELPCGERPDVLGQAEQQLYLHGGRAVLNAYDAYRAARRAGTDAEEEAVALLTAMRRDVGYTSLGIGSFELSTSSRLFSPPSVRGEKEE